MDTKDQTMNTLYIDQPCGYGDQASRKTIVTFTQQTPYPMVCDVKSALGENRSESLSTDAHWSATETIQAWAQSRMKRLGRYDSLFKQLEGLTLIESVQTLLNYIDDMEKGIEL